MLRIVNNPPIIRVRLKYPDIVSFAHRYSHRFTSKGLFLVVKTPSLPGAQVRFELLLEGGDVAFAGLGEITWIKPFPDSKGFYGMIIRFINLDDGCQEILQLALSHKEGSRKDAFDHQKIAEDQLPDDQVDTTPFISQRRFNQPNPEELATNRYPTVAAAEDHPTNFEERTNNARGTLLDERHPADDDLDDEAPTEDTTNRKRSMRMAPAPIPAVSDYAPTNRNPSLALIEGLAAQRFKPSKSLPAQDDPSDITTHDNIPIPKIQSVIFGKISGEDDAPTDSSTKELILPIEARARQQEEPLERSSESTERSVDLDATDLAPPITPPDESPSIEDIAHAITKEKDLPVVAALQAQSAPELPTKKRSITMNPNDPPTSIRIMIARPIPSNPAEQDAELERLAHEVGLADLTSLVGWSKELIKNLPRKQAQIEQELMALAIAAKKFY